MTFQLLINVLLIIGVLLLIGARQLRWTPLNLQRIWIMPVVLIGAGAVTTLESGQRMQIDAPSVGLLLIELVIGTALGAVMGRIAKFRRLDTPMQDRRGNVITWQYRTGWLGVALWVGLLVVRVGIDVAARFAGFGGLLTSTGVILAVVGVNRLANAAFLHHRFQRTSSLSAA